MHVQNWRNTHSTTTNDFKLANPKQVHSPAVLLLVHGDFLHFFFCLAGGFSFVVFVGADPKYSDRVPVLSLGDQVDRPIWRDQQTAFLFLRIM